MNDTDDNTCVVYIYGIFFISARCIQNSEFAKNAHGNCMFWYGLLLPSLVNFTLAFSIVKGIKKGWI
jgi:hypothetical protein